MAVKRELTYEEKLKLLDSKEVRDELKEKINKAKRQQMKIPVGRVSQKKPTKGRSITPLALYYAPDPISALQAAVKTMQVLS